MADVFRVVRSWVFLAEFCDPIYTVSMPSECTHAERATAELYRMIQYSPTLFSLWMQDLPKNDLLSPSKLNQQRNITMYHQASFHIIKSKS